MRKKAIKAPREASTRERLDQLIDAVALVIARRQMKHYWAAGHR
jgi:hypothetical protein